ncbi:MAG: hypothetical protein K2O33_07105 [Muribaculaceae bacterium]|nr:hypothetical protein [Muribaculaceae bacterium]
MKKIVTLATVAVAFSSAMLQAQDFATLATPEEILANSVEDEAGAKAAFESVLNNAEATEAEKTDAMHLYMQLSTPAPGYAFDMSFLLSYNSVHETVSTTTLNTAWKTEVPGVDTDPAASTKWLITNGTSTTPTTAMRAYSVSAFGSEESFGKFIVYQEVELTAGAYYLSADAYASGAAKCANLAAGDALSDPIIGGGVLKAYNVSFNITDASQNVKIGIKRNDTAGKLTHIYFNDMYLYKVSNIVEITDASEALDAATDVNVIVKREFEAGVYYPICLPFVVENWREVFSDLLLWNNYADGVLEFKTVAGANTQARKPYMVKFDNAVTADNYLRFNGVTIQKGNAGSWQKTVAEGETAFPVSMQGNWAAMELPEKCYWFDGGKWVLADGSGISRGAGSLGAFSAYIDASGLETCPEFMGMKVNDELVTLIEVAEASAAPAIVNVYNLQGMAVKTGVSEADALEGLPCGIYIVNGKKIVK